MGLERLGCGCAFNTPLMGSLLAFTSFSCMMRRMGLDNKMERGCCSTDCSILVPQNITRRYSDIIG